MNLPSSFLHIALRENVSPTSKYDKEIRKFALTVNFYSPKAYTYVWKIWKKLLPAPSTLRGWYRQINGDPGFCDESFCALRAKNKSSEKKVICNLVFDEMDIRTELTFRNNKYHGYVDMGFGEPSDSDAQPLAKKALVLMLVCMNARWKLPIGYFLVDSLHGDELKNLVNTALELVDDCGIIVRSLTCDGAAVNRTCCKLLGANLNIGPHFQPWFPHPCHPDERVFVLLDPSHALKLVRNTIGDYTLTDSEGRQITFHDIQELFYFQEEKELSAAPRLTKRHIKWRENKMRVKLAAQVLSNSVYAALISVKEKKYKKFESCEGTALFCQKFDQIFDMMNSRSKYSRKLKKYNVALDSTNVDTFSVWCQEAEEYILGLKINDTPIFQHDRKTGFVGFIQCLRSIVPLFKTLQNHGLQYLLTYKVSQDHLENYFSAVRSKGGNNNNPNAEQFKGTFKRLLVHHELRTSENANCSDDNIEILDVGSSRSISRKPAEEDIVSRLAGQQLTDDELHSFVAEDIICASDEITLDAFQEDVVAYLAGYILFKLKEKKKLHSNTEIRNLIDPNKQYDLIDLKNRGGLTIPSTIAVNLCRDVEKEVILHESKLLNPATFTTTENEILMTIEDNENHKLIDHHVLELIVKLYIRIKINYLCKRVSQVDKNIRHESTKRVHQNHQ
jgi:hypothetical protein